MTTRIASLSRSLAPAPLLVGLLAGSLALAGCDLGSAPMPAGPPVVAPTVEALQEPWLHAGLREVVDLQVERDGEALRARLGDDDPGVRARAALALASVQDPGAEAELSSLLGDPEAAVRREAAFALGQLELGSGSVGALFGALDQEEDPAVRHRLVEAIGKRGDERAAGRLLALAGDAEAAAVSLALSRMALRGVEAEGLLDGLTDRLTAADPDVRLKAAYYFGRVGDPEPWTRLADRVREALDGYELDDPAAMHLVLGLGLQRNRGDRDRFFRWMNDAEDWRIRTNAARALGTTALLEAEGVREALFRRVESDPSMHVAVAAASTLTMGFRVPDRVIEVVTEWMLEGPRDRWRTHVPFLGEFASRFEAEALLAWIARMEREHPVAVVHGIRTISVLEGDEVTERLRDLADHRDPVVRASAVGALGLRSAGAGGEIEETDDLMTIFDRALRSDHPLVAVHATRALQYPAYRPAGAAERLAAALRERDAEEPVAVLEAFLIALGEVGGDDALPLVREHLQHAHPRVRAVAGQAHEMLTGERVAGTELPDPERRVDWARLEALGASPALHLETERGEIVVRLAPAQAPLTVQALAELVEAGAYDETRFHRVVPNFVIQGGDFALGDGTGSPGYSIRSEFTRVPFERGVIGMASSGKDTEGSQFFLTHSLQPHLDGGYTAFGWVESGEAALDNVLEGDLLVRARIVSDH